jgi:glycerol-1-phosphate dehydrogenase [NAD(P)+]
MLKPGSVKIAIPAILEVGRDNLGKVGKLIAKVGFGKAALFLGAGIYELVGEKIVASLAQQGIQLLRRYDQEDLHVECMMDFAFSLPARIEVIIGVGGGKVLDVAKYVSFLNNLPFISIPTSVSNDGFASSGCSLLIENRRRSVPAQMPWGIIVDIGVIQSSPARFIFSGIGDLVSKITALYDWEFEEAHGKARVNDFAALIAKKSINSLARMDLRIDIREEFFLEELVDSLIMSGIAMEIAGSSAPASGSEHLISHSLDQLAEQPQLHGLQVGIATYLMSLVQNHRQQRIAKFLTDTGFFDHVKTVGFKKTDFAAAIELAPEVKPDRYTYLHLPQNRELAKRLLEKDPILREVLG